MNINLLTVKRLLIIAASSNVAPMLDDILNIPRPYKVRIGWKAYPIPSTANEVGEKLTYGQRLYMATQSDSVFDNMLRVFSAWYSPLYYGKQFSEKRATKFLKAMLKCNAYELLTTAKHLNALLFEILENEAAAIAGPKDPLFEAAGGEALNQFAILMTLDFLAEKLRCNPDEVLEKSYYECLAWQACRATINRVETAKSLLELEKLKKK